MDALLCPHRQPGRCYRQTKCERLRAGPCRARPGSRGPRWSGVPAAAWGGRRQGAGCVAVGAGERAARQAQAPQVSSGPAGPGCGDRLRLRGWSWGAVGAALPAGTAALRPQKCRVLATQGGVTAQLFFFFFLLSGGRTESSLLESYFPVFLTPFLSFGFLSVFLLQRPEHQAGLPHRVGPRVPSRAGRPPPPVGGQHRAPPCRPPCPPDVHPGLCGASPDPA